MKFFFIILIILLPFSLFSQTGRTIISRSAVRPIQYGKDKALNNLPFLQISYYSILDQNNGDFVIQPDESVSFSFHVTNVGEGSANEIISIISLVDAIKNEEILQLKDTIDTIPSGEYREFSTKFTGLGDPALEVIKLKVDLKEKSGNTFIPLELEITGHKIKNQ